MPSSSPVLETAFDGLTRHNQGKVRDIYSFPEDPGVLLIVATDRISAFDYVLGSGIPDKGKVLTQLSAFWFGETSDIVANHMRSTRPEDFPAAATSHTPTLCAAGRCSSRKTEPFRDRMRRARLSLRFGLEGISADRIGLRHQAAGRPARIGPAAGADFHAGDQGRVGPRREHQRRGGWARSSGARPIEKLRQLTLRLYSRGAAHAEHRGIIVADTKFEFGRVADGPDKGEIILIDEVLTPDSSRFWPRDLYMPGGPQPSFDKQFVRDYLEVDPLEQAAARAEPSRRRHREDAREVHPGVPSADRPGLER